MCINKFYVLVQKHEIHSSFCLFMFQAIKPSITMSDYNNVIKLILVKTYLLTC